MQQLIPVQSGALQMQMHGTGVLALGTGTLALTLEEGAVVRRPLLQPPPFLKSHSTGCKDDDGNKVLKIVIIFFNALAMYLTDMIMLFGNAL